MERDKVFNSTKVLVLLFNLLDLFVFILEVKFDLLWHILNLNVVVAQSSIET